MREKELKRKGWSDEEIQSTKKILHRAEKNTKMKLLEHAIFWTVIIVLSAGGVAFTIQLLPLVALASPVFSLPLGFVVGAIIGLLLVHVIHDLRLNRNHHHVGTIVLVVATMALSLFILLAAKSVTELKPGVAWSFALFFGLGVLIPYIVHWRVFGEFE